MFLRGGRQKIAGLNKFGTWNVDGQWKKGDNKVKILRTPDGFTFSRSQMRRQKRKWKQQYGDAAKEIMEKENKRKKGEDGESSEAGGPIQGTVELEEETFTPEGLMEKVKQLRSRLNITSSLQGDEEMLERLKQEEAGKAEAPAIFVPQGHNLDEMAKSIFKEEFKKDRAQGEAGRCFVVSGAGTVDVNGLYVRDRMDMLSGVAVYKKKSPRGIFTLMHVREDGRAVKEKKDKSEKKMGKWIIFCNSQGVKKSKPYYQAVMLLPLFLAHQSSLCPLLNTTRLSLPSTYSPCRSPACV
eukprot:759998-Hanusia_phi.AAC.2